MIVYRTQAARTFAFSRSNSSAASSPASTADQLSKLADLRDRGVISAEEFEREKAKVLGT